MRALLDVNVLIALHDRDHIHHERAAGWFAAQAEHSWASCPLTQNGRLRIMSQPGQGQPQPLPVLVAMLRQSTQARWHAFWPDDLSVLDPACIDDTRLLTGRQLTNVYLLALAVQHGGRLVTFDRRVPLAVVRVAREDQLVVL